MFLGTPSIEQISDTELRITGIALDPAGTTPPPPPTSICTIGFSVATGPEPDIRLPDTFKVPEAVFGEDPVSLAALVKVDTAPESADGLTNLPPSIRKTGTTGEDFRVTITNTKVDLRTQTLEIYLTLLAQEQPDAPSVLVNIQDSPDAHVTIKTA